MTRRLGLVLAAALLVRLLPILAADRVAADVLRYQKAAQHVLDVSWNPYLAPRLYPYPPLWIWVEAGSEWLARATGMSFAVLVKLPVLFADLGIVLACWASASRSAQRASWLFALHPVSILVTGFHGQFDSVMLFFVLLSLRFQQSSRPDAAALSLAAAIATKSFPILLLPLFVVSMPAARAIRFALLATLPVLLLLLPYAIADRGALARELLAYGGVADFGWIGTWRGLRWTATGALARSDATHWPLAIAAAKVLFLAVYAAGVWAVATRRWRPALAEAVLAVFLAFLVFYGAISAQYLLWPVPLGAALLAGAWFMAYSVAATAALLGFYLFLAPGVLTAGGPGPVGPPLAGMVWACGALAVLAASAAWLLALVRRGRGSA